MMEELKALHDALVDLFITICEELRIDKIVEYLSSTSVRTTNEQGS